MDYRGSLQSELMGTLGAVDMHYGHQLYSQVSYPLGPYHPDYLSHMYSIRRNALPFSSGDTSDVDSVSRPRTRSAHPYIRYLSGLWRPVAPHFVHLPMLPSGVGAEDSPIFFYPPMIQHQDMTDALFVAYLHPPMLPPDDSPSMSSFQLHPPMLPGEWKMHGHSKCDTNAMVTF